MDWRLHESVDEMCIRDRGLSSLICKPIFGTHGEGVEKLAVPEDMEGKRQLYDLIMSKPKSVCEELIVQHHEPVSYTHLFPVPLK